MESLLAKWILPPSECSVANEALQKLVFRHTAGKARRRTKNTIADWSLPDADSIGKVINAKAALSSGDAGVFAENRLRELLTVEGVSSANAFLIKEQSATTEKRDESEDLESVMNDARFLISACFLSRGRLHLRLDRVCLFRNVITETLKKRTPTDSVDSKSFEVENVEMARGSNKSTLLTQIRYDLTDLTPE
jgi:hypothetical protein